MPLLFLAFLIIWNKNLIFQTGLLVFMALCGANIDHLDFSKMSVLTYGVFGSNVHIVKKLLNHGCKTNVRDTQYQLTEIEAALDVEFNDIFKMLAFHEN